MHECSDPVVLYLQKLILKLKKKQHVSQFGNVPSLESCLGLNLKADEVGLSRNSQWPFRAAEGVWK